MRERGEARTHAHLRVLLPIWPDDVHLRSVVRYDAVCRHVRVQQCGVGMGLRIRRVGVGVVSKDMPLDVIGTHLFIVRRDVLPCYACVRHLC